MSSYYLAVDGKQTGPFDEATIRQQVATGQRRADDLCWCEGMTDWQPIESVLNLTTPPAVPPPPPVDAADGSTDVSASKAAPLFLYIPVSRLVVLSVLSMNLYEAYWIYKNWNYIRQRDALKIRPFWRGFFGVFFCHSLLRRMHGDPEARAIQEPQFSAGGLATGWVAMVIAANIISRFPSVAAGVIAALIPSFLCLVPVQIYINAVTERRNPGQKPHAWSSGHIVCLVFGVIVWLLLLLGLAAE